MLGDSHMLPYEDVRLLRHLFEETLCVHAGKDLLETVEAIRALAESARGGNEEDFNHLAR